jgi:formylglycine-generating enzyme required for sulfatase activity
VVTGGTFSRSYDNAQYKDASKVATVSDFRIDRFEVTVARFRAFVAAYPGSKPLPGDGANPNDPNDQGWDDNDTNNLPADQGALMNASGMCDILQGGVSTWTNTPGVNESMPINCMDWNTAFAFCAWDNGRLPTEAEWNYAASHGADQRVYPWGNTGNPITNYAVASDGVNTALIQNVGTKPAGVGGYGTYDLAGNVWEWVIDYWDISYSGTVPCNDCALHTPPSDGGEPLRVLRGGSTNVGDYTLIPPPTLPTQFPPNSYRGRLGQIGRFFDQGIRCVRSK